MDILALDRLLVDINLHKLIDEYLPLDTTYFKFLRHFMI